MSILLTKHTYDIGALCAVFGVDELASKCEGNQIFSDFEDRFMLMVVDSPLASEVMAA
jgi:hypothetical protein